MKIAIIAVIATILVAVVNSEPPVKCPPVNDELVTLLPNPKDCKTYYSCNYGIPYLMQCNPGLEFNPIEKVCDYPEHAKCTAGSSTAKPGTTAKV